MAPFVKHPTLGLSLGPDLKVLRSSPELGFACGLESASGSLLLPLPFPTTLACSLSNK